MLSSQQAGRALLQRLLPPEGGRLAAQPRRCQVSLPPNERSVAAARRIVRAVCAAWNHHAATEDAELIVSELLGNAIRHAAGSDDLMVELADRGAHLTVSVADGSALRPEIMQLSGEEEAGRGMLIVEHLALDWGTEARQRGKRIWVDLDAQRSDD